ncbi:hypothetical protein QL285_076600 [Trifolium repens]|nr:hypothetical protein QL285_076600 [Trifolium repens]
MTIASARSFIKSLSEVCKTITANQVKVWPLKGKVPSAMLSVKKAMIISMEAAVKALDEQKTKLEKVIFALKQEQAEEEGLAGDNAGVDNAGASVGAADGDAAENDDGDAGGDTEELEVSDSSGSF